jgi:hypothetical protein
MLLHIAILLVSSFSVPTASQTLQQKADVALKSLDGQALQLGNDKCFCRPEDQDPQRRPTGAGYPGCLPGWCFANFDGMRTSDYRGKLTMASLDGDWILKVAPSCDESALSTVPWLFEGNVA